MTRRVTSAPIAPLSTQARQAAKAVGSSPAPRPETAPSAREQSGFQPYTEADFQRDRRLIQGLERPLPQLAAQTAERVVAVVLDQLAGAKQGGAPVFGPLDEDVSFYRKFVSAHARSFSTEGTGIAMLSEQADPRPLDRHTFSHKTFISRDGMQQVGEFTAMARQQVEKKLAEHGLSVQGWSADSGHLFVTDPAEFEATLRSDAWRTLSAQKTQSAAVHDALTLPFRWMSAGRREHRLWAGVNEAYQRGYGYIDMPEGSGG